MQIKSLSVFFPMYNERHNIEAVLAQAKAVIPELGFSDYEILFVDDGSRDGCDLLVEAQAQHDPHIRLVRHPHNMGYGAALRTGFTQADREAVFYTDCDLPVDLRDIARALSRLQEADLVIGYRIKRHETLRRAVYSRIYNLLMRLLFGVRVRDVNFSFKLVRGEVLRNICLSAKTVFIDGQLLAEAVRCGYKIAEIPVEYTPRKFGRSNFDSLKTAWATLTEMLGYWVNEVEVPVSAAPVMAPEHVPAIASLHRKKVV
jgi:glycosyltransferase involved in cell wall biosynthesis